MITAEKQNGKTPAENVKNGDSRNGKKQALRSDPTLKRTTFRTSREMDFFSEKELVTQTGHEIREWPLVILKELIDNALDACEETDTPPVVDVMADACGITIRDNGPGLPEKTLKAAMDFTVRASNREAYVAPDRGQQGNALKTILPMPVVIDPVHGKLVITAHGKRHVITCGADPISQRAIVNDDVTPVEKCKNSRSRHVDKSSVVSPGGLIGRTFFLKPSSPSSRRPEFNTKLPSERRALLPEGSARCSWLPKALGWQRTSTGRCMCSNVICPTTNRTTFSTTVIQTESNTDRRLS